MSAHGYGGHATAAEIKHGAKHSPGTTLVIPARK